MIFTKLFDCLTFIHSCNSAKSFLLVYIYDIWCPHRWSQLPQWPSTSKFCFLYTAQIRSSSSSELPDFYWRNGQNGLEWGKGVRTSAGHVHLIKGNYGTRGSSHQSPQEAFPIPTPAGLVSHSAAGNDFSPSLVCHQLLMLLSAISLSRTAMRGLFNGAYVWVNLRQ